MESFIANIRFVTHIVLFALTYLVGSILLMITMLYLHKAVQEEKEVMERQSKSMNIVKLVLALLRVTEVVGGESHDFIKEMKSRFQ